MRVAVVIEWKGGDVGWWGSASVPRRGEITIRSAHSPTVVRKRLRRALIEAGVRDPELDEEVRIPVDYHRDLEGLEQARAKLGRANAEFNQHRLRVARRLLTELNMTEREVGQMLGISGTHLANLLKADTVDTDEYVIGSGAARRGAKKSAR